MRLLISKINLWGWLDVDAMLNKRYTLWGPGVYSYRFTKYVVFSMGVKGLKVPKTVRLEQFPFWLAVENKFLKWLYFDFLMRRLDLLRIRILRCTNTNFISERNFLVKDHWFIFSDVLLSVINFQTIISDMAYTRWGNCGKQILYSSVQLTELSYCSVVQKHDAII